MIGDDSQPDPPPPVLDPAFLDNLAEDADEDDRQMLRGIIDSYCGGRLLAEARQAIQSADWEMLERSAHSLKGLSSTLGALAVAAAAHELESLAESGDAAACQAQLAAVTDEHERSRDALRSTKLYASPPRETCEE